MKKSALLVVIVALVLFVAGCNKTSSSVTEDQQSGTNAAPQAAPVAPQAETPPVGPPTVVAEGKTIEEHVTDYFEAYREQRLEDAFELAPAEVKAKQPMDQFVSTRKGMPITAYTISTASESGNTATIQAEYTLSQFGTWVSTWTFEKQDDRWVAVRYLANQK
jgi:predicted small secreted protein